MTVEPTSPDAKAERDARRSLGYQPSREVEDQARGTEQMFTVPAEMEHPDLFGRYEAPPYSVLDRRQGFWRTLARQYLKLGIQSELGREGSSGAWASVGSIVNSASYSGVNTLTDGVSVFDPVVCHLAYKWFCLPGGVILDPFAGGSVRGIVAAKRGYQYFGIDLSAAQVQANIEQGIRIISDPELPQPRWRQGDSREVLPQLYDKANGQPWVDFVFTCPPYGDLEVYSDHPADLSNMSAKEFNDAYRNIVYSAARALKANRFAGIVVGNYRSKTGRLRDLVGLTVQAAHDAGLTYYNEAIIIDPIGTGAIRAPRQFAAQRKLVRTHQQLLIFVKGDPKVATQAIEPTREEIPNGSATD